MYAIITNQKQIVFITSKNRMELNQLTNQAEDVIFNRYGDVSFNETRNYDEQEITFADFLKANPEFANHEVVKAQDFVPEY